MKTRASTLATMLITSIGILVVSGAFLDASTVTASSGVGRLSATSSVATEADRDAMVDALAKGDYAKAKKLHKKGVSFDALSPSDDMTGLMRLADDGIEEAAAEVLKLGANINARNTVGESAVWYATYSGHEKLALSLITRGASVAGQRPDSKECLLHMAVQADLLALSKKLMKITPECAAVKDSEGNTPAAIAKAMGYSKIAKIVSSRKK